MQLLLHKCAKKNLVWCWLLLPLFHLLLLLKTKKHWKMYHFNSVSINKGGMSKLYKICLDTSIFCVKKGKKWIKIYAVWCTRCRIIGFVRAPLYSVRRAFKIINWCTCSRDTVTNEVNENDITRKLNYATISKLEVVAFILTQVSTYKLLNTIQLWIWRWTFVCLHRDDNAITTPRSISCRILVDNSIIRING